MLKNRGILPIKSINEKFEPIILKRKKKSQSPKLIDEKVQNPLNSPKNETNNQEPNIFNNNNDLEKKIIEINNPSTSTDLAFVDQFLPLCIKIETPDSFEEKIRLSLENVKYKTFIILKKNILFNIFFF